MAQALPRLPCDTLFTLTGSIYSAERFQSFVTAFAGWRERYLHRTGKVAHIYYAGGDHLQVSRLIDVLKVRDWVTVQTYLDLGDLAALCKSEFVAANMYIKGSPFHHKLLELLSADKPVVAYGGETEESFSLAKLCQGALYGPSDGASLAATLDDLTSSNIPIGSAGIAGRMFSWSAQAAKLEQLFRNVSTTK